METPNQYRPFSDLSWMHRPLVQTDPKMPVTWRALIGAVGGGYEEAITRGAALKRRKWCDDEMLTAQQVASRLCVAPQTVSRRRRTEKLLGLDLEGKTGYRYPAWQFDGKVLSTMPAVLKEMSGINSWKIYFFLLSREGLLDGKSPLQFLRKSNEGEVIQVIKLLRAADEL